MRMIEATKKYPGGIEETRTLLQNSEEEKTSTVIITRTVPNVKAEMRLTEIIGVLFEAAIEADRHYIDNICINVVAAERARIRRDALMYVICRAGLEKGFELYRRAGK